MHKVSEGCSRLYTAVQEPVVAPSKVAPVCDVAQERQNNHIPLCMFISVEVSQKVLITVLTRFRDGHLMDHLDFVFPDLVLSLTE